VRDEDGHQPCVRGGRCAARDYQGNPAYGPRAFCDTDRGNIAAVISRTPETYIRLRMLLPPAHSHEERVSGSAEAPVPLNLDVEALMREIMHVACSWEDQVRGVASLAVPPDGARRDAVALTAACATLHAHVDTLLSLPGEPKTRYVPPDRAAAGPVFCDSAGDAWEHVTLDGTDAGLEFLALDGRARAMLGLTRRRRRITEVRCDQCAQKTLVQYEAQAGGWEPLVRCTACPNTYTGTQYELLMGRVYNAQVQALARAS
jgi:hypothetical protein